MYELLCHSKCLPLFLAIFSKGTKFSSLFGFPFQKTYFSDYNILFSIFASILLILCPYCFNGCIHGIVVVSLFSFATLNGIKKSLETVSGRRNLW